MTLKPIYIGVFFLLLQQSLVTVGLALQRVAAMRQIRWLQCLGLFFYVGSQPLNLVALAFAPESIIAPLSSSQLLMNTLASKLVGEQPQCKDWAGSCMILCSVGVIMFMSKDFPAQVIKTYPSELVWPPYHPGVLFNIITTMAVPLCWFVARKSRRWFPGLVKQITVICLPVATGVLIAMTQMYWKVVGNVVSYSSRGQQTFTFGDACMAVIACGFSVLSVVALTLAVRELQLKTLMPLQYVVCMLCMEIQGALLFHEFDAMSTIQVVVFILVCVACVAAVLLITWEPGGPDADGELLDSFAGVELALRESEPEALVDEGSGLERGKLSAKSRQAMALATAQRNSNALTVPGIAPMAFFSGLGSRSRLAPPARGARARVDLHLSPAAEDPARAAMPIAERAKRLEERAALTLEAREAA